MRKLTKFFFIFLLLNTNSFSSIKNNIVVKIENEIITNFEIKNRILGTLIINNQEINQQNINLLKKQTLETLILLKLKKLNFQSMIFLVMSQRYKIISKIFPQKKLVKLKVSSKITV